MKQGMGGELIAKMLKAEGVDTVFGIIDGTYFGMYSNFSKYGIRLITPRHETSAAHMAGAYARLTGKLGVCMASNGPGVANVLPGVAVENGEGNRVLLITSCRRAPIVYPDRGGTYQYFNQVAVTKPMTKWSGAVPAFARLPEMLHRAFRMSWIGRPGVVHLDVPESIMNSKVDMPDNVAAPASYRVTEPMQPAPDLVQRAAALLRQANSPMIHAGSGILHALATPQLVRVAELLEAPVTTSWAGRGAMPEGHPLAIPMIHLELNRKVRNEADIVLALGSRIGETDWWGKAPYWAPPAQQKLIQVDIDSEIIGLNRPTELAITGDVKVFLIELAKVLENQQAPAITQRKENTDKYRAARSANRGKLDKMLTADCKGVNSAAVGLTCQQVFGDDAVLVADGGNTSVWANFFHAANRPNRLLSTFKFGMLGAGVAQAIGAKAALPDCPVYSIIGDGAMGFHPQEIETAVRNNLPVIYVVLCDRQWGMVKINQHFALKPVKTMIRKSLPPEESINTDLGEIRFDELARAMGAHGERVSRTEDLKPALERALQSGRCAVVHVDVDPVKHMWAPGLKSFKDMHQEPGA